MYEPELPIEPKEEKGVTADCGCEVYSSDADENGYPINFLIEWNTSKGVKTMCYKCLMEKWGKWSPMARLDMLDVDYTTVERR